MHQNQRCVSTRMDGVPRQCTLYVMSSHASAQELLPRYISLGTSHRACSFLTRWYLARGYLDTVGGWTAMTALMQYCQLTANTAWRAWFSKEPTNKEPISINLKNFFYKFTSYAPCKAPHSLQTKMVILLGMMLIYYNDEHLFLMMNKK